MFDNVTFEELTLGIKLSHENADNLFKEATILLCNNCIERAYTLFQLSIEESGKAGILLSAILNLKTNEKPFGKEFQQYFYFHNPKSKKAIQFNLIGIYVYCQSRFNSEEERDLKFNELSSELYNEFNEIEKYNRLKNQSLYVEFKNNSFISPKESISLKLVEEIRDKAKIRIQISKDICEIFIIKIDEITELLKTDILETLLKKNN